MTVFFLSVQLHFLKIDLFLIFLSSFLGFVFLLLLWFVGLFVVVGSLFFYVEGEGWVFPCLAGFFSNLDGFLHDF